MFDQDYVSCQKEGVVERRHEQEVRDGFTSWVEMIQLSITASAQKCSKLALFLNLSNLCIRNCTRKGIENLVHGWWMLVLTKVHAKPGFLGIPGSTFWQSPGGWGGIAWKAKTSWFMGHKKGSTADDSWDIFFLKTYITCCKSWRVWLW